MFCTPFFVWQWVNRSSGVVGQVDPVANLVSKDVPTLDLKQIGFMEVSSPKKGNIKMDWFKGKLTGKTHI